MSYLGVPAVRVPYQDQNGATIATRYRTSVHGPNRFSWKGDSKPALYGISRLTAAEESGFTVLVAGETSAITLWFAGIPAVAIPEDGAWMDEWSGKLLALDRIYVVVTANPSGQRLLSAVSCSPLRSRLWVIRMDSEADDVNAAYRRDPEHFGEAMRDLLDSAVQLPDPEAKRMAQQAVAAQEAWLRCHTLAERADILQDLVDSTRCHGVAGEERTLKLIYLVMTSRVLDHPVSAVVKGASSAGKSYLVSRVLDYFPEHAYLALTSTSPKALLYTDEPLSHRVLVVYEAAGLTGDFASYLVRTLISEGDARYLTVDSTEDGLAPRTCYVTGPISLLLTTTQVSLHAENENRLLSIPVDESGDQTKAVLIATARGKAKTAEVPDESLDVWRDLQVWIEGANHDVHIPYAERIALLTPPLTITLRRSLRMFLDLIETHAILHQASRAKTAEGLIVASYEDYAAILALVGDLIARNSNAGVSGEVREVVAAVRALSDRHYLFPHSDDGITVNVLADHMKLARSTVERRVREAIEFGYLQNIAPRGKKRQLQVEAPLPDDTTLFPTVEHLMTYEHEEKDAMPPEKATGRIVVDVSTGEIAQAQTVSEPPARKCVVAAQDTPPPPDEPTPSEYETYHPQTHPDSLSGPSDSWTLSEEDQSSAEARRALEESGLTAEEVDFLVMHYLRVGRMNPAEESEYDRLYAKYWHLPQSQEVQNEG